MTKYKISTASKDDKIFNEGFTISEKNNLKPRFKLGTQADADKFNKGGVQKTNMDSLKYHQTL